MASPHPPGSRRLLEALSLRAARARRTTGRDPRHVLGETELLERAHGVPAADHRERIGLCDGLRDRLRPLGEPRPLEDAHRPVPENRPRGPDPLAEQLARRGTDVEAEPAFRQHVEGGHPALGVGLERGGCDDVAGEVGVVRERILVAQLLGHLASDEDGVRAGAEVHQHAELVVDLRPARDEHEGALDVAEEPTEHLQLLLEQKPCVCREQMRYPLRGRVRSVRRAERVVHEQVPPLGEATRSLRVVLRLARIEARVLEHLEAVVRQELVEARRHGRDRERRIGALRPAEVRADGDVLRTAVEQVAECRQRRANPRVVCDLPVLEGNVQVRPHEDALAADVGVTDRARPVHPYGRSLPIRSTSRLEYPHSLSYQPNTFTVRP